MTVDSKPGLLARAAKGVSRIAGWRPSRAVAFTALTLVLIYMLIVLASASWHVASEPVHGTEGQVSQANLLVGVFQAILGLAIATATIYYAVRSGDMVKSIAAGNEVDRRRHVEVAAGNLIGAALRASVHCGSLAMALGATPRLRLPSTARLQEQMVLTTLMQTTSELSDALRWSEELIYLMPDLRNEADSVVDAASEAHQAALHGDATAVQRACSVVRQRTDRLREVL